MPTSNPKHPRPSAAVDVTPIGNSAGEPLSSTRWSSQSSYTSTPMMSVAEPEPTLTHASWLASLFTVAPPSAVMVGPVPTRTSSSTATPAISARTYQTPPSWYTRSTSGTPSPSKSTGAVETSVALLGTSGTAGQSIGSSVSPRVVIVTASVVVVTASVVVDSDGTVVVASSRVVAVSGGSPASPLAGVSGLPQ